MSATALILLAVGLIAVWNDRATGKYILGAFVVTALFVESDFVQENMVTLGTMQIACGMLWFMRWSSSYDLPVEDSK